MLPGHQPAANPLPPGRVQPRGCAAWTAPRSPLTRSLAPRWGAMRSCARTGLYLVVTTDGTGSAHRGSISVLACIAHECQRPTGDSTQRWRTSPAPHRGGVTILAVPNPSTVVIDVAGYQLDFDPATMLFRPS